MRIVWGISCIALAVAVTFVLALMDFLLIDALHSLLAGAVTGTLFMIAFLIRGGSSKNATKLLCFAIIGSVVSFAVAWAMVLIISLNFIGNAALAFDLFTGVIGAAVVAAKLFDH